jgi:surface polysaccharide O-acyltransferase-like enzyme
MARKIFGWLLIAIAALMLFMGIIQFFAQNIKGDSIPITLLMVYVFAIGGIHLVTTKSTDDPIPAWAKCLAYIIDFVCCFLIATIIGSIVFSSLPTQLVLNWLCSILFFITVQFNVVKKILLKIFASKQSNISEPSNVVNKADDNEVRENINL